MAIALLTDFGTRDPYVGIMKGTIAQIAPGVPTIDLTHDIPPQDIAAGRFALASAVAYFPLGTIFLAVVDPGVGSARRAIAVACARGYLVGPDNGLFGGVLAQFPARSVVELENSQYWLQATPSATFHGRDVFAAVAAHLAMGVPLENLGRAIALEDLKDLSLPRCRETTMGIEGAVQAIDRFGNLATNIPSKHLRGEKFSVWIGDREIPDGHTYSDVPMGTAIALAGSHGWLEIAINGGSAMACFGASVGTPVRLTARA